MTMHPMGAAPTVQASEASILFDVREAISRRPATALRSDAATSAAAEMARQYGLKLARAGVQAEFLRSDSAAERFAVEVMRGTMDGLGWKVEDGTLRSDASNFAPMSLTDVQGGLIRPAYTPRVLSEIIPVRQVDADAEFYMPSGSLQQTGSMTLHRPGQTEVTYADAAVTYAQHPIHTFITATRVDWREAMVGSRGAYNVAAEKAASAREVGAKTREAILANGVAGINFRSLANIGLVRIVSSVDYGAAPTLDTVYADLTRIVQRLKEAVDYTGTQPNVLGLGPRWLFAVKRLSNYNAGGAANGNDLLATLAGANAGLAAAIGSAGITQIVEVPSLRNFGGDATKDGAVMLNSMNPDALRQVVAMALSPVRTATSLTADETLWVMRHGGLDVQDATSVAIAEATVA